MQHNLVGRDGFAKGMKLYFERHDGQAVTCDDFVQAIADANPASPWRSICPSSSAGTARPAPACAPTGVYDAATRSYALTLSQSCPATPGQPAKSRL